VSQGSRGPDSGYLLTGSVIRTASEFEKNDGCWSAFADASVAAVFCRRHFRAYTAKVPPY
jgi:hypothetical protein